MESSLLCALFAVIVSRFVATRTTTRTHHPHHGRAYYYDLIHSTSWKEAGFEEKWEKFRTLVPLEILQPNWDEKLDVGPVCQPGLYGPPESHKLAILQHGFLACPGIWYRIVPQLVKEGFRVMLPLLPGHGRKSSQGDDGQESNPVDGIEMRELFSAEDRSQSDFGLAMENSSKIPSPNDGIVKSDDLADLPVVPYDYRTFADILGQLAAQFKTEHPGGIVAVAGHSLGGAVTIQYAQEYGGFIDRVLVLNPMLGLSSNLAKIAITMTKKNSKLDLKLSKGWHTGGACAVSSGGTCEFTLRHIKAFAEFGQELLCNHFGIPSTGNCGSGISENKLADVTDFQVLSSWGENRVDNSLIAKFVQFVQEKRALKPHWTASKEKSDFCLWPQELGHSYLSNRPTHKDPEEKWWHPYVEVALVDFLNEGKNVDILRVGESGNSCLERASNVDHEWLTTLPAIQHQKQTEKVQSKRSYWIGYRPRLGPSLGPSLGGVIDFTLEVLFRGQVVKESNHFGTMRSCHIEIVQGKAGYLLVTRSKENDNVHNIYLVRNEAIVGLSARRDKTPCARLEFDLVEARSLGSSIYSWKPLAEALKKVEKDKAAGVRPYRSAICGNDFVKQLCSLLECKNS